MIINRYFLYNIVKENRVNKFAFVSYFVAIFLIIYFLIISIFGERGLFEYYKINKQANKIVSDKLELQNKIKLKKEMIRAMDYGSLDLDLIDEQSRKILGYVGKNEVVIYRNNPNPKKQ